MRLSRDEYSGTPTLAVTEHCFIELFSDWGDVVALFRRDQNWYSFHLIHAYVERDEMVKGIEITCYLLGFGFRLRWNTGELAPELATSLREIEQAEADGRLDDILVDVDDVFGESNR